MAVLEGMKIFTQPCKFSLGCANFHSGVQICTFENLHSGVWICTLCKFPLSTYKFPEVQFFSRR